MSHALVSVGIDVGSATTQVMLSRLWLDMSGTLITSRVEVVEREVLHASRLRLTPFRDGCVLDAEAIRAMVVEAYAAAGIGAEVVETGALIVTGDASRTDNARAAADAVAGMAGTFVCVAAGPHLEARLAAIGSGALDLSSRLGPCSTLLHVDIGGATTKLAVLTAGEIVETAVANVGARMLTFEDGEDERVTRATPALLRLAASTGIHVESGQRADRGLRRKLAQALARDLLGFIRGFPRPADDVFDEPVTEPLQFTGRFDVISYSGGVASYINQDESRRFGDLGPDLAAAVVEELSVLQADTVRVLRDITATVVGASQHTTQVSGATTHQSGSSVLPLHGLRVVPVTVADRQLTAAEVEAAIVQAHIQVDLRPGERSAIVSVRWHGEPSFGRLSAFADGLLAALGDPGATTPLIIAIDGDLAGAVGSLLQSRFPNRPLVCVDEVVLGEMDVVDIGRAVSNPPVLPVTIRSVVRK